MISACSCGAIHLYSRPLTSGRGSGPQVAEAKDSAPADNGQVISMPDVHVHATKDVRLGVDDVPLHRRQFVEPTLSKEFREYAAIVDVHVERHKVHSGRKHHALRVWSRHRAI